MFEIIVENETIIILSLIESMIIITFFVVGYKCGYEDRKELEDEIMGNVIDYDI